MSGSICFPQINEYHSDLAAIMVTYPSTSGIFEESIREICDMVLDCGGLVSDGRNLLLSVAKATNSVYRAQ
jgi:glycine dehydrogenase